MVIEHSKNIKQVDLVLNNGFYINENDINNIPKESGEYNKMKNNILE